MGNIVESPAPRCACMLVLDTSSSMSGSSIDELNAGLAQFVDEIRRDEFISCSIEIGIIIAGGYVTEILPITPAHQLGAIEPLIADGDLPLGWAVNKALDRLDARMLEYKNTGIAYGLPWLVIISSEAPADEWQTAADRAREMALKRELIVIPVSVNGKIVATLSTFSSQPAKTLKGLKFREFFKWFLKRISSVGIKEH